MNDFSSISSRAVSESAAAGCFEFFVVDGSGFVSCHFSPTHSPNPSLAPPGERGGLHVAASFKVGNLCATVRWPQSECNAATGRCPDAKTSGYFPPLKTRPNVAVRSPFRTKGGGEGLGERGGIQRIKSKNAADKHFGSSSAKPPCVARVLQKQELVTQMKRGLAVEMTHRISQYSQTVIQELTA